MYTGQKLLVANRGEIAVRILRTAKQLGIPTVAIYTPSDALSPHIALADEAVALPLSGTSHSPDTRSPSPDTEIAPESESESESKAYLSGPTILSICQRYSVTLLHPGYGFLSENAEFAELVCGSGITWLGPRPEVIRTMGLKHEARRVAVEAGLDVVPGSEGLLGDDVEGAVEVGRKVGFPVMLKATAGGGGMGMVVCGGEEELRERLVATRDRAQALFGDGGLFLERYFPSARHIEVQVFGNGFGDVVHMSERECSVQRRHQKIIEETPSPFLASRPGLRVSMCDAAVRLGRLLKYGSAGTIEFLVDNDTGRFYFLEMNTRIQVEHPITEATHPNLDLVRLMIEQGLAERDQAHDLSRGLGPTSPKMQQRTYARFTEGLPSSFAIEARIYSENPSEGFSPCSGVLQYVDFNGGEGSTDWLRIESWVTTGTFVSPFFDSLLCKLIVTGTSREQTISRLRQALENCKICGPPNNMEYLKAITESETFRHGQATTKFLDKFKFIPRVMKVLAPGLESTIQGLPERQAGRGVPRSGPMDTLAFKAANILVGNPRTTEGLEIVTISGVSCILQFHVPAVVATTGKDSFVRLNGGLVDMWAKTLVPAGGKLEITGKPASESDAGFRVYLAIRGGFPNVPSYLGSKSTSMGYGGYQGRPLAAGDQLSLGSCEPERGEEDGFVLPKSLVPVYPADCVIYVLAGPHCDEEFVTPEGITRFYSTPWRVSTASNRMGIRLERPEKISWARQNGGEGGSHPSNILDNGYAAGSVNINGDTPVILANEGPDMGGYVCLCTVASAEMWKLGQLGPGNSVKFVRVSWKDALGLTDRYERWVQAVNDAVSGPLPGIVDSVYHADMKDVPQDPKLRIIQQDRDKPTVIFRQAGDSAILVEYGPMQLDFNLRARIHALESEIQKTNTSGIRALSPCIRSTMCHYDPSVVSQDSVLAVLVAAENAVPGSVEEMVFPGRRITLPIVLDDSWNREALQRYMRTTRDKAVYLPSNIEYLAKNNGLEGGTDEALEKLVKTDWLVFGIGFYLACPFLVPIDPRCRLVGQKMNPSRAYTPRGAIGIAGLVAAIYPVESPGGYQLYGRTLPAWQTWGKGKDFHPQKPWLLQPFDQVRFEPVSEQAYVKLEKDFDAGRYSFKIEPSSFSMLDHATFISSVGDEVSSFRERQARGVACEEIRERKFLEDWESGKRAIPIDSLSSGRGDVPRGTGTVVSSIFASVWKIRSKVGDLIRSGNDTLMILEAMKTEITVQAGELNVGKTVTGFGSGIAEGSIVRPGEILVILE